MPSSSEQGYVRIGRIATDAPEAALLRALQQLRPQCDARLTAVGREPDGATRYHIAIPFDTTPAQGGMIDPWLRIKSALLAQFPTDKPHAVRALD